MLFRNVARRVVVMSMHYSPVNAVLWLTQTVYSSRGSQYQAQMTARV